MSVALLRACRDLSKLCLVAVWVAATLFGIVSEAGAYTLRTTKVSGRSNYSSNGLSAFASPSRDGRYIAFQSYASNFPPVGMASARVFLRDTRLAEIRPVSVALDGGSPNGFCGPPSISGDGRFVTYATSATNVIGADDNLAFDVVRRDMQSGDSTCVSLALTGLPADGDSHSPSVSADGRWVAFVSAARDLVDGDSGAAEDVFVRDMTTGVTVRVSVAPAAVEADGDSSAPAISADGSRVTFVSAASNLVVGDTNSSPDVFVWNRATGAIERVSVSSSEKQASGASYGPAISGGGTKVAFESLAGNLVAGDTNGARDIFVRDLATGTTTRASFGSRGAANRESREPSLSHDGRKVAFVSAATNLVSGDTNGVADVFVRDLSTRVTSRVNRAPRGVQANASSGAPAITADGTRIVYNSSATNLTAFDSNRQVDIFMSSWGRRSYLRFTGSSYTGTSIAVSKHAFSHGADAVVVANPAYWPDLLTASALAGTAGGPLLYASRSSVSTDTLSEILRLGATKVYVVGSTASVDASVAATLASVVTSPSVVRVPGIDRYALASSVASQVVSLKGGSWDGTVFVASGKTYAESLAAMPVAASKSRPFVFVDAYGRYRLPSNTKRAVILGRTSIVSRTVESRLKSNLGTSNVSRLAGTDRYSTAVKTAEYGVRSARLEWDGITVTSAYRPAEAACAGVAAGRMGTVVLLTAPTRLPTATSYRLGTAGVRVNTVRVVGPTYHVSSSTLSAMKRAMGGF